MSEYELIDIDQGSDEWLSARLNWACASEAPVIMGDSKYMSRNELMRIKKGWINNPLSEFKDALFAEGHECEDQARKIAEIKHLIHLKPAVITRVINNIQYGASLDGFNQKSCFIWEHKLINKVLSENVLNGVLEPHYYWQLEHQMLVANIDSCYFNVSDGTTKNSLTMVYHSDPARRSKLIAATEQFYDDYLHYEVEAKQEIIVASKPKKDLFPRVTYKVDGLSIVSNIAECEKAIEDLSAKEKSKTLETDQDFANKNEFNKAVKTARSNLKTLVENLQADFLSLNDFMDHAKNIDAILQKLQSHGEKLVSTEKDRRKAEIVNKGLKDIGEHLDHIDTLISPYKISDIVNVSLSHLKLDLEQAMKNKRKLDAIKDAIDTKVMLIKSDYNALSDLVVKNIETYKSENVQEHLFLFADIQDHLTKDCDHFCMFVDNRIDEYKKEQEEKAERERQEKAERERQEREEKERQEREEKERQEREEKERQEKEQIDLQEPKSDINVDHGQGFVFTYKKYDDNPEIEQSFLPDEDIIANYSREEPNSIYAEPFDDERYPVSITLKVPARMLDVLEIIFAEHGIVKSGDCEFTHNSII